MFSPFLGFFKCYVAVHFESPARIFPNYILFSVLDDKSLVHIRRTIFLSYDCLTMVSHSQIAEEIVDIIKEARNP